MRAIVVAVALAAALAGPARAQEAHRDDDESELLVREARAAIKGKRYDEAARRLDRALAVNPGRVDAHLLRASVHAVKKEYERGVALMRRARVLAPENPDVQTALGSQLILAGSTDEGVGILEAVVRRWPDRYQAQGMLGTHYAAAGEHERAIIALTVYLAHRPAELAPGDATYVLALADAELRGGDPRAARARLEALVAAEPGNLKAQVAHAWAAAAVDCREAAPLLEKLAPRAEQIPEIVLVEGRCALRLGQTPKALVLSERYLARRPEAAAGHALRGEAQAAAGDLLGARKELGEALRRAPGSRLYAVRLARVERQSGDARAAVTRLRGLASAEGAPDDGVTVELAEALLASGEPGEAERLLAERVRTTPGDAGARTALGAALLARGDGAAAAVHLEEAVRLDPASPRARRLLVSALAGDGIRALRAGDAARAEALVARAAAIDPASPELALDLGIIRLAAGRTEDALASLEQAATGPRPEVAAVARQLQGRALGLLGRREAARRSLEQSLAAAAGDPARAAEVALDLAALDLAAGDPAAAVSRLEPALARAAANTAAGKALRARVEAAFVVAARAEAGRAMTGGSFFTAARLLLRAEPHARGDELTAVRCDLALAATGAGDRDSALSAISKLAGASCPFPAPADSLAIPILAAVNDTAEAGRAERALAGLAALEKRATGPAARLLTEATRTAAVRAAAEAYARGNLDAARRFLDAARRLPGAAASPELVADLAILDLAAGRVDEAIAALARVADEVPEAVVNLGVAYDRKGQPQRALEMYQRAATIPGLRFGPLKDWIAAKQRVLGLGAP